MKLSVVFLLASAAASLHVAAARVGARVNPLGDAMDALVNKKRFFRGYRLHRLMQNDDDTDAACESELEAIYSDKAFMRTLFKINRQCPAQLSMTETEFSMAFDFSDCDEENEFEEACAGLSGEAVAIPDISVSCSLDYDEMTYTSSYSMVGAAVCAGASCSQEYDAAEAEQTGDEMAAEAESEMAGILAIFGIEGTVNCDVDIDHGDAAAGASGRARPFAPDEPVYPTCKSERIYTCNACINRFCDLQPEVQAAKVGFHVKCMGYSGDQYSALSCTCAANDDKGTVLAKCKNTEGTGEMK